MLRTAPCVARSKLWLARRERRSNGDTWKAKLQKIERELEKAIDVILVGAPPLTLKERIEKLEAHKVELTALLADVPEDKPDLLPTASAIYARRWQS